MLYNPHLDERPYTIYSGPTELFEKFTPAIWRCFQNEWNKLSIDRYLQDDGSYRYRRFSRLLLDSATGKISNGKKTGFFQSRDVNPVNGGYNRDFSPLKTTALENSVLHMLLNWAKSVLPTTEAKDWEVGVHMIRIVASELETGHPTPEGPHRDGHAYVVQILVKRYNVQGGESTIYTNDHQPLQSVTLLEPLDAIVVDDTRVLHGVSEIRPKDTGVESYRDMLLFDFNPPQNIVQAETHEKFT